MLRKKRLLHVIFGLCVAVACGASTFAQGQNETQPARRDARMTTLRTEDQSDLAQENMNRVAASAAQIRGVLSAEAGLMVEVKRIVAKEATDSGQVIDDTNLTDTAIYERLEQDVTFRSKVTRLLQRYGYLVPTTNPDSDTAKENALVLQERARRLVQIEAQEDAESLRPQANGNVERTAACDPQLDDDCPEPAPANRRQRTRAPSDLSTPQTSPQGNPRALPQSGQSRILQADGMSQTPGLPDGTNLTPGLEMTSGAAAQNGALPGRLAPLSPGATSQSSALMPGNNGVNEVPPTTGARTYPPANTENGLTGGVSSRNSRAELKREEEFTPVRMVHQANPYADIPSLYDMYVQASPQQKTTERFGLDVFRNNANNPDLIPMDLPVGPDYVVGPGDGLEIDLWGGVSQRLFRVVDRQGRVSLPEAGPLLVSGRNLGDVQQAVQQVLRTEYRDVSADVSLSRLRTVRVYVVGEVEQPGAYDISSLSTPLNALFAAGGVTPQGSLRTLKHFRGNELVEQVDAYDLLLHGLRSGLHPLQNGDTLLVPPLGPSVTVDGMVRRPAIYELNGESSLTDVLDLAGGILPTAALSHIEVQRIEAHEKRTMLSLDLQPDGDRDSIKKQLDAFKILDGDHVHIFPIAPYNEDVIYLQGHVLRPGRYSYKPGMKLSDVIGSYKDLLPEPAPHYAEIVRLNPPDFHPSVESFDLFAALADPATAPKLQPLDTLRVFSRFDFEPAPEVLVAGEVRSPGRYRTSGQSHIKDAVYLAGGVTQDASLDSAQLFRTESDGSMKILSVNLRDALAGNPVDNLLLQPRDRLIVHRTSARVDPPTVYVKGEVAKPGRYPLTTNMHVEDLVRVSGGLKRSADPQTADLTTYEQGAGKQSIARNTEVNLSAAMTGNPAEDVPLHDGDVLTIRQVPGWNDIGATVSLKGEFEHPGTYGIKPGERLSSVIARAGGFNAQAYPYGAVLMRGEVLQVEMKSRTELMSRIQAEQVHLRALPEGDPNQRNTKLTAISQSEASLEALQTNPPIGRVVIHVSSDVKQWRNTPRDIALRAGDMLVVPKKTGYVAVSGEVFNPTAIGFEPGRSAKWYLSQAGGLMPLADKKAVFVIRADGSVIAAKNNSDSWWFGSPLSASLRPGDMVVVPEKAPRVGGPNWASVMQSAQLASSVALAVAYIHP